MNPFAEFNQRILDFANAPENRRLLAGTGTYSTPFRGSLFGMELAADVANELERRPVDVLWLGLNPNVPESLERILDPTPPDISAAQSTLSLQIESGFFGEIDFQAYVNEQQFRRGTWNPVNNPQGGWSFYQEILEVVKPALIVTMANFVPWGSKDANDFIRPLRELDPELVKRIFAFCDELNADIVKALRPRLILAPLSLREYTNNSWRENLTTHEVKLNKRTFRFYTGEITRGSRQARIAHVPHPSSLRFTNSDRERISTALTKVLGETLSQSE